METRRSHVPGLVFTGDLSAGNKGTTIGVADANGDIVSAGVSQVVGGIKWVAFLISKASGPAAPGGFAVVGLGESNGIGMLFDENIYGIDTTISGGPVTRARTSTAVSATTVLLVTKLDFTTGMEYIFVNPVSGSSRRTRKPMPAWRWEPTSRRMDLIRSYSRKVLTPPLSILMNYASETPLPRSFPSLRLRLSVTSRRGPPSRAAVMSSSADSSLPAQLRRTSLCVALVRP